MNFYKIARPILFRLDAERAHDLTLRGLRIAQRLGITSFLSPGHSKEPVKLMGLNFPNRVGLAAGLDKSGNCVAGFGSMGFGFVEVGTITPVAQEGNPRPRLFRVREHEAIINRMGFNNPGIETALHNIQKSRKGFEGILGINIGKNKKTPNENALDDYLHCFRKSYTHADYIAVNVSSPNTSGLRELQTPKFARELLSPIMDEREKLKEETGKSVPVAVKIDPDMGTDQIKELSELFIELELDAIIATNTTVSRDSINDHRLSTETGGLSGSPLNEKSNKVIAKLHTELKDKVPIIGVGGINSKEDAQEKLSAGASLVQIYTGLIYQGPSLIKELAEL